MRSRSVSWLTGSVPPTSLNSGLQWDPSYTQKCVPLPSSAPNGLAPLPASEKPSVSKEREPTGAQREKGREHVGETSRLPQTDLPVPEHPQVRSMRHWVSDAAAPGPRLWGGELNRFGSLFFWSLPWLQQTCCGTRRGGRSCVCLESGS